MRAMDLTLCGRARYGTGASYRRAGEQNFSINAP